MIKSSKLAGIIHEETRLVLRELEAHEEDTIYSAYHGGGGSAPADEPTPTPDESPTMPPDDNDTDDDASFIRDEEPADDTEAPDDDEGIEHVKKSLFRRFNDSKIVDFGLDVLGTVGGYVAGAATAGSMGLGAAPAYVLAAVPDLLNSLRHGLRGDAFGAGIYFLCALPIIGEVLGPVRLSMKFLGTAARTDEVYHVIDQARTFAKQLKASGVTKGAVKKVKEVSEKHLTGFDGDTVERDARTILYGTDEEVDELLRRSGYIRNESPRREAPDDDVSTEVSPKSESKKQNYVSIILESSKPSKSSKSSSSKPASKKLEKLPPIPTTVEFEREMRDIVAAHYVGEDIESWLSQDILGSKASPSGISRKTGWTGDDDFYRKSAASYIAQHLATHRDPELREIGQRVLRKMGDVMGHRRLSMMGSGLGLDPDQYED